ncbi:MAG: EAL domain-containing protein [Methylotenera sp.]|nr:EAL domain-containing protein [Methylotenera sp.]MDD4924971.1 EAL domain-containing protein [Methylotenera sp.]
MKWSTYKIVNLQLRFVKQQCIRLVQGMFVALLISLYAVNVAHALSTGDQAGAQAQKPTTQLQKSTLIVGSEQDFPPFATGMTDETAGGFTVELWKAVAAEAGLNYHIRVLPFHQLLNEFKGGKIDVLINLDVTDEAHVYADFSLPHAVFTGGIFVRSSESNIKTEADLNGKSIIMMKDDVEASYVASKEWGKRPVLVETAAEGMRLLASGKHDAMLINKVVGLQTLHALELTNVKALKAKAGFTQKFAFAVHEGQSELLGKINEGLVVTKVNGNYNTIYDKWFGVYELKEIGLLYLAKYLIPIILLLLSVIGYSYYKRQLERNAYARKFRILFEMSPVGMALVDHETGDFLEVNEAVLKPTGYTKDEFLKLSYWEITPKEYEPQELEQIRVLNETGRFGPNRKEYIRKDGSRYPIELSGAMFTDENGKAAVWGVIEDISARKEAENNLRIAATAFQSQEGVMITDANRLILRVNNAFTSITGYSLEEVQGQNPRMLSSGKQNVRFYAAMWDSINSTGGWEGEIWNRRKNGEIYPEYLTVTAVRDDNQVITNYVGSLTDITLRKVAEEQIQSLAFYDPLTQLPNRRLMLDRLNQAYSASSRTRQRGALLFLDLDYFKTLNDTLGHDVGDLLLQQVATRLTDCVREGDTVARVGGDGFVVLLESLSQYAIDAAAQAQDVAEKIMFTLNQPYQLNMHTYHSTTSLGVALFNGHELNTEDLLKQADIALYQSKAEGRNTLRFFDPKMQETIAARADLENELRKAVEHNQFQLYYQIQVGSTGQALGAEALIRWLHPERGMISPFNFIPLAEDSGLILPIGQWVLNAACAQIKIWERKPVAKNLTLAVNMSAKQFKQVNFVEQVEDAIKRHEINPTRLKIELTESLLVDNVQDIISKITKLSKIGIRFSLDDFGTGYSSLQYLKQLPLDQLKIDQSFVRDITTDASDRAIVRTIITMAHSLDVNVIAEGVETAEQQQFLLDNGCTHYQGYLFGKPLPIDEFEALLELKLR